jgi:hypothetical protein
MMQNLLKHYDSPVTINTTENIARLVRTKKCDQYYGKQLSIIRKEQRTDSELPSIEQHQKHGDIIRSKLRMDEDNHAYMVYCIYTQT